MNRTFCGAFAFFAAAAATLLWPAMAHAAPAGYVTIPGEVYPIPAGAQDLGPVPAAQQINLAVALPLRNQAALEALVKRLYDPTDSLFGQYLTPTVFAEGYSPLQSDYNSVKSYLQSAGLTVTQEYSNRLIIDVAGPASAIEGAFSVTMEQFQSVSGRNFHRIATDPYVPDSVAPNIVAILGLDNSIAIESALRVRALQPDGAKPANLGPNGPYGPLDLKTAYNLTGANLIADGLPSALNGAGQSVALIEFLGNGTFNLSDINTYTSHYSNYFGSGYTAPLVTVHLPTWGSGQMVSGGLAEMTSDIECVLNMAPYLTSLVVFEGGVLNAASDYVNMLTAIATDTTHTGTGSVANIVSTSWWFVEVGSQAENEILQQMQCQGQTVLACAGDNGSYNAYNSTTGVLTEGVCEPAAQPAVTGVGGTTLTTNSDGTWNKEVVWNNGGLPVEGLDGGIGGGGVSGYWPIPSYQSTFIPASNTSRYSTEWRNVPDVSLNADNAFSPYSVYFGGAWYGAGGTSLATPTWAGFMALVNQERSFLGYANIGFVNPFLYKIASGSRYSADFHDITSGHNYLDGTDPKAGYMAGPGYDCASGWGSFNGANLMSDLALQNLTYVLWSIPTINEADLWKLDPDVAGLTNVYAPVAGYEATAISAGPNGYAYILWTAASGAVIIWKVGPQFGYTQATFGPSSGWTAISMTAGPDGNVHVLWNGPGNEISIWNIAPNWSVTSTTYGPYAGWTALQIAMDANDCTHVLWNNSGEASLWNISAIGTVTSSAFGPYPNWQPQYLAAGADANARILWNNTSNGDVSLWIVTAAGAYTDQAYSPPASGATAVGFTTSANGDTDVLWTQSSTTEYWYWDVAPNWTYSSIPFGPEGSGSNVAGISGYCGVAEF